MTSMQNNRWDIEKSRRTSSLNKIHDKRVGEICDVQGTDVKI